ncbi:MAG: response regulator [Armatimonadetes bacterium]|nr:response regulator [Armatimonadota bacterium]
MLISSEELRASRILLVDDDPAILALLERVLRAHGFSNLTGICRGEEAVQRYVDIRPDLVLLDLNMPGVDGFAVIERLQELQLLDPLQYVPILVLTGDGSRETRLQALASGARDFLQKPFDQEIVHRIQNLLEVRMLYKRTWNQNQNLELAVRGRTQELQMAQYETLRRLGIAAEYRDDDTGTHILRMSHYCELVAATAGLAADRTRLILHASPMHDIGKIGIPDSILLKKGKLDPEEWVIMKSHTLIGGKILSGGSCPLLRLAESIALTHHERWDGNGYPHGLRGEEIPVEGRITAVCDVFDALTSERPYKRAWTVEEAVAELARCRGSQFQAELVDAFLDVLPQVLAIRERFSGERVHGRCA